jgi:hypothetical protein
LVFQAVKLFILNSIQSVGLGLGRAFATATGNSGTVVCIGTGTVLCLDSDPGTSGACTGTDGGTGAVSQFCLFGFFSFQLVNQDLQEALMAASASPGAGFLPIAPTQAHSASG